MPRARKKKRKSKAPCGILQGLEDLRKERRGEKKDEMKMGGSSRIYNPKICRLHFAALKEGRPK